MPGEHAKLSASGAKKWLNCPASVTMEADFPDTSSAYAAEGTTAHALGEIKLLLALNRITRVQFHKTTRDLEITEDMEEYTDAYRDFVIEEYNRVRANTPGAQIYIERRLDFSSWVPGGFGTGDAVIIGDDEIVVVDLKYGQGVKVDAKDNPQLRLYALGALAEFGYLFTVKDVKTVIFQPRVSNISEEVISVEALIKWGLTVKDKASLADSGTGECAAGEWCDSGFCKARAICHAYAEEKSRAAAYEFRLPAELTPDEIAEIIDLSERLASWSKLVKDYALDTALRDGVKYPGFKVVEGRSNRAYGASEADIAAVLTDAGFSEDDIYTKELLGISKMEKLLSKKRFNELLGSYIVKPPGKPTLVPTEDKRPEWDSAVQDFKEYIEKE